MLEATLPSMAVRSVFLSDLHLGWRLSDPVGLAPLLLQLNPQCIYLVGDIVELETSRWMWLWTEHCQQVLDAIKLLQHRGTQVKLLPGNHDAFLAMHFRYCGWSTDSHAVHVAADGRRYLVVHGDCFDHRPSVDRSQILEAIAGQLYNTLLAAGYAMRRFGLAPPAPYPHWCSYWKRHVRRARRHVRHFVHDLTAIGRSWECQGVICGHIHQPAARQSSSGFRYVNCGDWVEHQTLVAEGVDGGMQLLGRSGEVLTNLSA